MGNLERRSSLSLLTLALALAGSSTAMAGPPCASPSIAVAQPVDSNVLKVSRIAGAHSGLADTWDMRYDAWFCNPNASSYTVSSVKIEHLTRGVVTLTKTLAPLSPSSVGAGVAQQLIMVRDDTQYAFPLPSQVRLTFTLTNASGGTLTTLTNTHTVAEHINPGPLQAYFFPARQSDLPAGAYWSQGRHAQGNNFQRWGYDLGVQQWDGTKWITNKPGTTGTLKTDSLTYDRPIYAMSDGLIIGCNRGAPDNDPADHDGNVPGGNLLWVRTGNETTLYAHLKQYSIPYSLCPFSDDQEHELGDPENPDDPSNDPYRIRAGQYLGRTGNSGYSRNGGSHLHLHTFMGLPAIWGGSETGVDADARPLEFVNVRVQERNANANVSASAWNHITSRKLLPYNTRIEPNHCGFDPSAAAGKPEVVHLGVPGSCFPQMTNAMFQSYSRPVYIDVHGLGSSSESSMVWRPADGSANVLLAGLDDTGLANARTTWITNNGFRFQHLEAYAEGGVLKHAVIFTKGPVGGEQYAQASMTAAQLQSTFNTKTAQGFVPVNISASTVNGVAMFDALFEKKNVGSFVALAGIPIADYQDEFEAQADAGRELAYIDGYEYNGQAYVSAIWYGNLSTNYGALHGQSEAQMSTAISQQQGVGRLTRGITQYTDGSLRYAGLWR